MEDEEKAKKKYSIWLFPNLRSRYQLCKKAMIEADTTNEHLRQKDRFDGVFYHPAVDLRLVVVMVMKTLKDYNYIIIGGYGMRGVGKSILIEEIAKQAKEK